MNPIEVRSLRTVLDLLIRRWLVETVDPSNRPMSGDSVEQWFKDLRTEVVYRLVEKDGGEDNLGERVPQVELQMRMQ